MTVSLNALTATVNTSEYKRLLEVCDISDVVPIVKGPPGCGKTAISKAYAMRRKAEATSHGERFGYCELNLANANLLDIMGHLALADREYEGFTVKAGEYSYPYFWYDLVDDLPAFLYPQGLMVIEEYGQGGDDEKRALGTLLLEKRIGRWRLPPGWRILLLSNRDKDRSGVGRDFDFMINRRIEAELKPDLDSFLEYANDTDMMALTKAFISVNAGKILHAEIPEVQGPFATLRSMTLADQHVQACMSLGMSFDEPLVLTGVAGLIGMDMAAQYMAYHQMGASLPKWSEILGNPYSARVPDAIDQQYLITHQLAHRVDVATIGHVLTYMQRLPRMFLMTFAASAKKKCPGIVNTAEFGAFQRQHLDLIAAAAA